jgi:hypothetical protein
MKFSMITKIIFFTFTFAHFSSAKSQDADSPIYSLENRNSSLELKVLDRTKLINMISRQRPLEPVLIGKGQLFQLSEEHPKSYCSVGLSLELSPQNFVFDNTSNKGLVYNFSADVENQFVTILAGINSLSTKKVYHLGISCYSAEKASLTVDDINSELSGMIELIQ